MSFFSKTKAVLWPKAEAVDLYLDKSENNIFSLDLNLWKPCSDTEIQSLDLLLNQNKINLCTVLVPDDVVFTKSFIYDTEITSIDKSEVVSLAESFVHFKIHPDYIDYKLIPSSGKTIILAHIFDRSKIDALKKNLSALTFKSFSFESVSQAISQVITRRFDREYFLVYPLNENEYTLLLSSGKEVYLTANLKGPSLDVQKTVNYSNLYFSNPTTKFYIPQDRELEIAATGTLDKTPYNQTQIAKEFKKNPNLPLPVLGIVLSIAKEPVIIQSSDTSSPKKTMENKKNILPFVIVFIITTLIASAIIYFVLTKNNNTAIENPIGSSDLTPTIAETPTETPTPTVVEINKKLKLQVLNATEINGQAAMLKEKLTKLGFTSVAVGNSKETLTENQIKMKASQSSASAYFKSQLGDYFSAVTTADLKETSTYDIVFYIGTDLSAGSKTPSPTPLE